MRELQKKQKVNLSSFKNKPFIRAISPRAVDKITTEWSKELLNNTDEIKAKYY